MAKFVLLIFLDLATLVGVSMQACNFAIFVEKCDNEYEITNMMQIGRFNFRDW